MNPVERALRNVFAKPAPEAGSPGKAAEDSTGVDLDIVRDVFDCAGVGLVLVSLDGEFLLVNKAFAAMVGYPRESLIGQPFRKITHPDDADRDAAQLARAKRDGVMPETSEKRFVRADKSTVFVRRSATLLRDKEGRPSFIVGAFIDLTEQRGKDRALRTMNNFLTAIIDTSPIPIYATTPDGIITFWNPAAVKAFGFTREEAIGKRAPFVPEEKRDEAKALRDRVLAGETLTNLDLERRTKDGRTIHINGAAAPLRDETEKITGIVVMCFEATDAKLAERALNDQLHFTRALIDAIPSPVWFKDPEGRYRVYNRAWDELFGGGKDWIGKSVHDLFDDKELAALHHEKDARLFATQSTETYESRAPTAKGESREMLYNKVSFVDPSGAIAGLIGVITDVTRYKETERALEASEARFRVLTESTLDVITVIDPDGTILYQSPALKQLVGYDPQETIGKNVFNLVHRDDADSVRTAVARVVESHQSREPAEFRVALKGGGWRTMESLGTNCLDNPHIRGLVFNSRDVTDRKQIQQKIQHLAYHDNLTGLPNRSLLQDRLAHAIQRAERNGKKVAVLFIDLDNFKNINDTLGHDVGDELLRQVSKRLQEAVRVEDTIARQGGDEFIVLLDGIDDNRGASVVAQKILNSLRAPFVLGGSNQHVSGSLGIALYPEDGHDAQTLMKNADTAMFHGKSLGKNTYQYFTAQMNIAVKRRMTLESALRRAVMQKDFVLHYQPQVDLETGRIVAVEGLVRWESEDSGTILPGDFIPLAEEIGLIGEIGEWVLREGCRQMKEWKDLGLPPKRVALNLSARQFVDKSFVETMVRVLADSGLEGNSLELEITESQVMRQTEGVILLLNKLADMGIHIAIDDFGTGYSSLSYLKRLPIQKLKIDQSFIRDITVDPNDTAITVAIINMARSLDLETIAEGIETAGQLSLLKNKGCRLGQGFYFSEPLSARELLPLLQRNDFSSKFAT
jgi:diguanylate cyclase (GGDEF)-like protein/PAS domain S-box-containing protein